MCSSDPSRTFNGVSLRPGETLDDLQFQHMKIIQRADAFRFGTDAVLLSDFALLRKNNRVADLGTGAGAVSILLCAHHETISVDAVEIQEDMAEMAQRSARMNQLDARMRVHCMDMRNAPRLLGRGAYDAVVCNPPYSKQGAACVNESENKRISRHEGEISLGEVCACAGALLKTGGRFSVVYPAQRIFDMMQAMQACRLAPKRVRCVQATPAHAPRLMLLDAVKNGGAQLHWLPPLILKNLDGAPTAEWTRIYG